MGVDPTLLHIASTSGEEVILVISELSLSIIGRGVPAGAIKLWRSGLEKLEPYRPVYLGINVGSFINAVKENLIELEAVHRKGEQRLTLAIPLLTRVS